MKTVGHIIGGKDRYEDGGRFGDVFNPASGEVAARLSLASDSIVDEAVATAQAAFLDWREHSLTQRTRIMFAFRELVLKHSEALAALVVKEHGKVHDDALGEVARGLEVIEFACGIPHLIKGGYSENVTRDIDSFSVRQPLGVCVGITPFNFPVMVPLWLLPVAIACGNTFVLKPSERDPSSANLLVELFHEAGLPEGVCNLVHGDRHAVDRLISHPGVAAVSSVGSTPVARHIYATATAAGKRVQALGGAKNHMVVLPDATIDLAADAAVSAAFGSAGERCMAISVVVAVGEAADPLVEAIRTRTESIVVGRGDEPGVQMGPLVTAAHRDRVRSYVDSGVTDGANLVVDGRQPDVANGGSGFFLGPCLLDGVTPEMSVYTDEIFGPVLSIVRVPTEADALALVNANPYGNGTAIFTADGGAARRFHRDVQVGMVGINVPVPVPMAFNSFGGWKASLFGDAHVHGMEGVRFYTRAKEVTARWPERSSSRLEMNFPTSSS